MEARTEDFITFATVAAKFHVSAETVRSWHRDGIMRDDRSEPIHLEAIKPGRMYLTTWEAIQNFVNRRENGLTLNVIDEKQRSHHAEVEARLMAMLNEKPKTPRKNAKR